MQVIGKRSLGGGKGEQEERRARNERLVAKLVYGLMTEVNSRVFTKRIYN